MTTKELPGVLAHATPDRLDALAAAKAACEEATGADLAPALERLWDLVWDTIIEGAEIEAAEYLAAAEVVQRAHTNIGAAEACIGAMVGNHNACRLVAFSEWHTLLVPGARGLKTLRGQGLLIRPAFDGRALAGADDPVLSQRRCAAGGTKLLDTLAELVGIHPMKLRKRLEALKAPAGGTNA